MLLRLKIYIALVTFFFFTFSCRNEDNCVNKTDAPINPNGDSELAVLMREMVLHAQASRDSIEKNTVLPRFPENFSRIFFAKKTDTTIDKQLFDGLAQIYLNNLKHFYQSDIAIRKKDFNSLVTSCSGCHQNFCGGPLKRINKLYLPDK